MTKPVLLFEHPACGLHDPGPAHPEGTSRLPALLGALAADRELEGRLERRLASPASDEDLLRVHTPEHVASVRAAATRAASTSAAVSLDLDTAASARSWEAALAAAGCAVAAAEPSSPARPPPSRSRVRLATTRFACPRGTFVELLVTAPWNLLGPDDPRDPRTARGAGTRGRCGVRLDPQAPAQAPRRGGAPEPVDAARAAPRAHGRRSAGADPGRGLNTPMTVRS